MLANWKRIGRCHDADQRGGRGAGYPAGAGCRSTCPNIC
jgi:hypothetical protein